MERQPVREGGPSWQVRQVRQGGSVQTELLVVRPHRQRKSIEAAVPNPGVAGFVPHRR